MHRGPFQHLAIVGDFEGSFRSPLTNYWLHPFFSKTFKVSQSLFLASKYDADETASKEEEEKEIKSLN